MYIVANEKVYPPWIERCESAIGVCLEEKCHPGLFFAEDNSSVGRPLHNYKLAFQSGHQTHRSINEVFI